VHVYTGQTRSKRAIALCERLEAFGLAASDAGERRAA
jgi:hypothetical protein